MSAALRTTVFYFFNDMALIKKLKNIYLSFKNRETAQIVNRNYQKMPITRCGSQTGGFDIVMPNNINQQFDGVVMSFGIGEDLSFSEDLNQLLHPTIYAFDPTPRSVEYVHKHKLSQDSKFKFFDIGISNCDEEAEFHLPVNDAYVSGSMENYSGVRKDSIKVKMKSFATICRELNITKVDILKMDIEGSEFKVVPDIINSGIEVTQFCIETHERFFNYKQEKIAALLNLLYSHGYKCVSKDYVESVYTFLH